MDGLITRSTKELTRLEVMQRSVLLIAPPPILEVESSAEMFVAGVEKSMKSGQYYAKIAREHNCAFLDAGLIVTVTTLFWITAFHRVS